MAKKILIAEDEKPMAKALELKLTNSGFEVEVVYDGEAAVKALSEGKFDLVLLDLVMPKMDGFMVLEEVKKIKNKTPIIVSTNLSQTDDEKKARDLGAVDFLVKSDTSLKEIVDKVSKMLTK